MSGGGAKVPAMNSHAPHRSWLASMLTGLVLAGSVLVAGPSHAAPGEKPRAPLEVHFIDVGQGDSILIRSPGGKTVLIDAGNIEAGSAVSDYLDRLGVGPLDLAIASHPHLDHLGGMLEVLRKHRPKAYMDPAFPHPLENYDELLAWLEAEKIPVRTARGGRTITLEPGVSLELLFPTEPLLKGTRSDPNSNSVVARLSYGEHSFLFTGDSEDDTERRLMREGVDLRATVLKVAHHGGRHSTSDEWLSRVEPQFAVISCGQWNSYGHPTKEVLERLEAAGARTFRTDRDGDVIARTDGRTLTWETTGERSAKLDEPGGRRSFNRGGSARATPAPPPGAAGLVDLNSATAAQLEALPGIGKVTAQNILRHREQNGPFMSVDDLQKVKGIGPKLMQKVRPLVTVGGSTSVRPTPPAAAGPADDPGPEPVNLNFADVETLARASGLSFDQARLVVVDRHQQGPFRALAELRRVKGLKSAERKQLEGAVTVRVDLNRVTEDQLVALGLSLDQALAIVERRFEKGPYRSVAELDQIRGLAPATLTKVRPLLTVGSVTP